MPPTKEPQPNHASDAITKTGTTTVALTATDGVVLAADRRASLGGRFVTSKQTQKIEQVHPTAALTMAGGVGGLQAFIRTLRSQTGLYETRRGEPMSVRALSTLAGNTLRSGPYRAAQPILGGVDEDGGHVYDIDAAGGVVEAPYVSNGSGMQLAYGVLEREYDSEHDTAETEQVAARAVASAVERDTASGNGLTLASVTESGVDVRGYEDVQEAC